MLVLGRVVPSREKEQKMSGRFHGKTVLVTGGGTGLGLGAAQLFVAEGATVFIAGRRAEQLEAARASMAGSPGTIVAVPCDVTVQHDLDRLFAVIGEHAGPLDVVVANAGAGVFSPLGSYTAEDLHASLGLNLVSMMMTVQGALPLVPDGGAVVVMSSIEGLRGSEGLGPYAAAKAAGKSLARTWANELKSRRIRVNAISPGVVFTPAYINIGLTESDMDPVIPLIPAGRLGQVDEVARAIAFLASDDSSFVNGTDLVVDGGQTGVV